MTPNKRIIKSEIQNNNNDKNTLITQNFFNELFKCNFKNKSLPEYLKKMIPNTSRQEKHTPYNASKNSKTSRIEDKYISDSVNNKIKNKALFR